MRAPQASDRSGKPWLGIATHFVVGNGQKWVDGEVQATFRWHKQLPGAHAAYRDHNDNGIGICLIGNFDQNAAHRSAKWPPCADWSRRWPSAYAIPATAWCGTPTCQASSVRKTFSLGPVRCEWRPGQQTLKEVGLEELKAV